MTNKPMLSVEREVIEGICNDFEAGRHFSACEGAAKLRALLDKPEYPRVEIVKSHTQICACVVGDSGVCDCGAVVNGVAVKVGPSAQFQGEPVRWERMSKMMGGAWWPCANKAEADEAVTCGWTIRPLFAEQPAPVAHTVRSVMDAIQQARGFPVITSNQCHALARALNGVKP